MVLHSVKCQEVLFDKSSSTLNTLTNAHTDRVPSNTTDHQCFADIRTNRLDVEDKVVDPQGCADGHHLQQAGVVVESIMKRRRAAGDVPPGHVTITFIVRPSPSLMSNMETAPVTQGTIIGVVAAAGVEVVEVAVMDDQEIISDNHLVLVHRHRVRHNMARRVDRAVDVRPEVPAVRDQW